MSLDPEALSGNIEGMDDSDDSAPPGEDDLDAFFKAADTDRPGAIRIAARKISQGEDDHADEVMDDLKQAVESTNDFPKVEEIHTVLPKDLEGKFIVLESEKDSDDPFVLIPANIHNYVPWWGWLTIGLGLLMLIAGVVLMPQLSLDRLVSRLGDGNEANVRHAMRQIVIKGNERTVKKLYGVATSDKQGISTRLRAVDAMSLIERVPEVDRALLRLELSAETNQQVRQAAIAARKQREAYKTRSRPGAPQ